MYYSLRTEFHFKTYTITRKQIDKNRTKIFSTKL